MNRILKLFLVVSSFTSITLACDPNEECTREVGKLPCGSLLHPKLCPTYVNDPICDARKLVCRTQCGDINKDADMYILNAQTKIQSYQENAIKFKKKEQEQILEIRKAHDEFERIKSLLAQDQLLIDQADLILVSQAKIQQFIIQTKLDDPASLQSIGGLKSLIELNNNDPEIVMGLKMNLLLLEQNSVLQSLFLSSDSLEPLTFMKELIGLQIIELKKLESEADERLKKANNDMWMAKLSSVAEGQKIQWQRKEIEKQEARKCSKLI